MDVNLKGQKKNANALNVDVMQAQINVNVANKKILKNKNSTTNYNNSYYN